MGIIIHAHDDLQPGYTYELTAPAGKAFDPAFKPELTPRQMLELGVFGAHYPLSDQEFPTEWFVDARQSNVHNPEANFFGVDASQPLSVWQARGWIHPADPRGWFQWYCRYYMGRRMPEEDARQIKRWKAIRRHEAQIQKACQPGDLTCRRRQRQVLLHWAYDSRKI